MSFSLHPERNLYFRDNGFMGPTLWDIDGFAAANQNKPYLGDWPQPGITHGGMPHNSTHRCNDTGPAPSNCTTGVGDGGGRGLRGAGPGGEGGGSGGAVGGLRGLGRGCWRGPPCAVPCFPEPRGTRAVRAACSECRQHGMGHSAAHVPSRHMSRHAPWPVCHVLCAPCVPCASPPPLHHHPQEGSHMDMLHTSSYAMGIVHLWANAYMVLDGCGQTGDEEVCMRECYPGTGHLVMYDFNQVGGHLERGWEGGWEGGWERGWEGGWRERG